MYIIIVFASCLLNEKRYTKKTAHRSILNWFSIYEDIFVVWIAVCKNLSWNDYRNVEILKTSI